eukprot:COSAG02_NODE_9536_length_2187_cov_1.365421_1_plen_606_part_10
MMGPQKKMLGSKLEGTTLREVVLWKGADPRTRSNREPWKWDEHGLAMASPRRAADSQWRSSRQRREDLRQRREAGASLDNAAPHDLVTPDVLAHNPGLSEVQLLRAASYCGCSRRRFAAYLEEFSRQDATDGAYDCEVPVSSVVAEHCVEQEELVATGRYVREVGPARTSPIRRRRKPSLVTQAASEPVVSTDSDQEQADQVEDGTVPGDTVCTGLTEVGEASWAGTEHSVNGGLLVLGDDGEPESYHALKHVEGHGSRLLLTDDQGSMPGASSDTSSDEDESDQKPGFRPEMQRATGGETEEELESLAGRQPNRGAGDDVGDYASAGHDVGRPASPIQAYLRVERRPTTSAHARHDHEKAEVAFAQLRAQLADLKQRPCTSPMSLAAVDRATPAGQTGIWAEKETVASQTTQGCSPIAKGVARKTAAHVVASFGGMPALQAAGNYRRGRSGFSSPTAGIGGSGVVGISTAATKAPMQVECFGRSTSPAAANCIVTPPSSPLSPKPKSLKVATATVGNGARGGSIGSDSLDPVYCSLSTRTFNTGAPSTAAAQPVATSMMSISAPSLTSSSAVPVYIQARIASSYPQSGQSTRVGRAAARGALWRQ